MFFTKESEKVTIPFELPCCRKLSLPDLSWWKNLPLLLLILLASVGVTISCQRSPPMLKGTWNRDNELRT